MVAYLRFPPPPSLRDVVEHFWMVEGSGSAEVQRQILIPNGRPAFAVALAEPGFRHDPLSGARWRNEGSLFGIMTRPHVLSQSGPSSYVGAELKPWGVAALGRSDRLVDAVLPLDDWLGAGTTGRLAGGLRAVEFGASRADGLAAFLEPLVQVVRFELVERAVDLVEKYRGTWTVAELGRALVTPYSTLHRTFHGLTGVGPKQFSEIVRYFHFVGELLDGPADAAATLAALHGYYDQAHAARDFKRYTGVSASSFLAVQNGIAALMHERSVQDGEGVAGGG
ncbi:AraC-like DNA-binding protein [Kribbella sp. VKM Ac-2527]|uniref:AraC-like DNA-binding protein n=1 Tax=Kribbella caucasensis TaxID=2512215 RepID=A0A4R6K6K3_9ACTN|nr:AraC family transcriptional regulator [Kribbella sp. VKM Ac-2527]TDO44985.1 AraC-like DNA-binding protein [Kribbella sp. VKM Ac-2527]